MKKCVFLDRDGVLNQERGEYTFRKDDFLIIDGVKEALNKLKQKNYLLIVITNQAGISKGLYSIDEMNLCHNILYEQIPDIIDAIYFCPYHPNQTNSIARKPGSLMFEKAIAKFKIDPGASWMVGDKERDLVPAKSLGIKTVLVGGSTSLYADFECKNLLEATDKFILNSLDKS